MNISSIYSYLVYPSKHEKDKPIIGGAKIPLSGNLYKMLRDVFFKADEECNIPICFAPENGEQKNKCLSEITEFIKNKSIEDGRILAERLQSVTTTKSGLGLLFLISAEYEREHKFLISRFPADQGVIAEQNSKQLKVEFIEKVFLKSSLAYKAALYRGKSIPSDFWIGNAVDKQINYGNRDLARYWIYDFLLSDFKTTSKAGTKRLAVALKEAINNTKDIVIKEEISAAALLSTNYHGNISIAEYREKFNLSDNTFKAITKNISKALVNDMFEFDSDEFLKHISFKSVELNNGAILTASLDKFDECFEKQKISDKKEEYKFSTQGKIIDEKLKKVR